MKVLYSPYSLTPLKKANRLSSMDKKGGVYLKAQLGDKVLFADYFPHLPLGDRGCDQFLEEFKFQEDEYDRKVFDLLLRDHQFQKITPKKFFNHQLWSGFEEVSANIVKYKLQHSQDRNFLTLLERGIRVRLDANALFDRKGFFEFFDSIPEKYHSLINYIEDPLISKDWSDLILPTARDFIKGEPFDYQIYKPNKEFKPASDCICIYSSYLGGDLGRWHAHCELIENGNFAYIHGIVSEGYFEEEISFHKGNYKDGFMADMDAANKIYHEVNGMNWKVLCSM